MPESELLWLCSLPVISQGVVLLLPSVEESDIPWDTRTANQSCEAGHRTIPEVNSYKDCGDNVNLTIFEAFDWYRPGPNKLMSLSMYSMTSSWRAHRKRVLRP